MSGCFFILFAPNLWDWSQLIHTFELAQNEQGPSSKVSIYDLEHTVARSGHVIAISSVLYMTFPQTT